MGELEKALIGLGMAGAILLVFWFSIRDNSKRSAERDAVHKAEIDGLITAGNKMSDAFHLLDKRIEVFAKQLDDIEECVKEIIRKLEK